MKNILLSLLAAQSVSASAMALEHISEPKILQTVKLDEQRQIESVNTSVSFKAWSGGCTEQGHFSLDIKETPQAYEVTVQRNVQDICEAVNHLKEITLESSKLELSDIAGKQIKIINPLAVEIQIAQ